MKKGTLKLIGVILGIIASIIVISGAVKSGIDKLKESETTTSSEAAQVQVVDLTV